MVANLPVSMRGESSDRPDVAYVDGHLQPGHRVFEKAPFQRAELVEDVTGVVVVRADLRQQVGQRGHRQLAHVQDQQGLEVDEHAGGDLRRPMQGDLGTKVGGLMRGVCLSN